MKKWIKRSAIFTAIVLPTLVIAWYIHGHYYDLKLERNYGLVSKGMSEREVRSVMGKPDWMGKCGELGGFPDGCSREYMYQPSLSLFGTYAIFIDAQGSVLDKYKYYSP
jgi:hypothetical protein